MTVTTGQCRMASEVFRPSFARGFRLFFDTVGRTGESRFVRRCKMEDETVRVADCAVCRDLTKRRRER